MPSRSVINWLLALSLAALSALVANLSPGRVQAAEARSVLERVRANGAVRCGINPGLAGFSSPKSDGTWAGLDVDICRAVAAAVFGDARKVEYVPLSAKDRFTALQSGDIDVLARNATWTLTRNALLGINFLATNFFDGQAFMVKAKSGLRSVADLKGASICVIQGTATEKTLADYFHTHGMTYEAVSYADGDAVTEAFISGRCDALTSDQSQLAGIRSQLPDPKAHLILPEIIAKSPLCPAVRSGDDQWANVVRWSFFAMVEAEEIGLSSSNIRKEIEASADPNVLRFAGKRDNFGPALALDKEWAVNIVEQVGNYAESFNRNITPIGLDRGANRLWRDGGFLFTPPML